jgi:ankyrin repeat protein
VPVADDFSPLHYAALTGDRVTAEMRLRAGDDPDQPDARGFVPLHLAAQEWSLDVAALLLASGATVDATNRDGNTLLFVAVFNSRGRGEMIELLRAHGADPHAPNAAGQTPIGLARLIGNYDVARYFTNVE